MLKFKFYRALTAVSGIATLVVAASAGHKFH
jgi:hypothetical protein